MNKKEVLILSIIILIICSFTASAAIIHGTVYDLSLDKAEKAIVEINTVPKQQMVVNNGTYSFNVPIGSYSITSKIYEFGEVKASAEENITIKNEGTFVIDLILFPSFEEEDSILAETDFDLETGLISEEPSQGWIIAVIGAITLLVILMRMRGKELLTSRKKMEEDEAKELKNVLAFIKKEGGRATQKDIRKAFPQSEAKISLILTELEEDKKIRKIKKGRGNIIILNRK